MPQLGEEVYRLCDTLVDDVVCVSDDEIREAIRDCFEDTRAAGLGLGLGVGVRVRVRVWVRVGVRVRIRVRVSTHARL